MALCCPYLFFDGRAEEAMRTYERVLGGKLNLLRYSDAPAGNPAPPGCEPSDTKRVMHAMLEFEGGMLMASDAPNTQMAEPMKGVSVNLTFKDAADARQAFDGLAEGGQVRMPFGPTFWAEGFGAVLDRFGTAWMVGGGMRQG
jgi:PhnB protein